MTRFGDKTMGYDVKGNITHKKSVGVFDYSSNKPYAIDLISTGEGEDQVLERNQDITYNAMMRPSFISEGGKTTNFYYDADASRIKMQTKQGDVEELTRYYIGSQYEYDNTPEGTEERLFLDGDAYEAPAVFVKKNQKEYLYYLGRDYLGSITHVLDADGNLLQELSYDAWGRLRKPENHELYAQGSEINPILGSRGYTGHEHLTHYGLINMNARLYDPVVGRFLSPDPYIQAPDFSQNFNRYSYALNNPLIYTDPNGEFFLPMLIGGVLNLGFQALTGNIHNFGDGLKAFGVGAIAGLAGGATSGIITGAGFMAGAGSGAITGFAAGFSGSVFNSYVSGAGFSQILSSGLKGGLLGAGTGALIGGITQGIKASKNGGNFFNGKGYSETFESIVSGDDTGLGGDLLSNRDYYDNSIRELDWSEGKYGVDKIDIEGISSNPKFSYDRENGILYNIYEGYKVRGVTFRNQVNMFQVKTEIYLSLHKNIRGFQITLNHELIHAYHYALGLDMKNDYSEYSATSYSSQYIPIEKTYLWKNINYKDAFIHGYTWPNYLLKIK